MKFLLVFALFIAGLALVAARGSYVTCPHLYGPSHGRVVTSGYGYGSIARYHCDNGYGLYYSGYGGPYASSSYYYQRTCMHGGIWAGPVPRCLTSSQYYNDYYNYPYGSRPYYDDYDYGYGMYGLGGRRLYRDPYYNGRHGGRRGGRRGDGRRGDGRGDHRGGHHGRRYPYYHYDDYDY